MARTAVLIVAMMASALAAQKTLVLIENYSVKETHSIFLSTLSKNGHDLTYKMADDSSLSLFQFGELAYENVVILAPSTQDFGGDVNSEALTSFVDHGGNVFVAADSSIGEAIRAFAFEVGVEVEEAGKRLIDHLNFDVSDSGYHTTVVVDPSQLLKNDLIVGKVDKPLLYDGVAFGADPDNPLLVRTIKSAITSYCAFPDEPVTDYLAMGASATLAFALQARNNARVVVIGSFAMLSDHFVLSPVQKVGGKKFEENGNKDFISAILKWNFKDVGVLRISSVNHHLAGEINSPSYYTVMEEVIYSMKIEEKVNNMWTEFKAKDVQMEFVRIDPFVRMNMGKENGSFVSKFKLPDVYGVFQFKVDYKRQGYTFLYSSTQVPVRPLQHDKYERFIPVAYPYYASAFSMMIGVFVFSLVFLHYKDPSEKLKTN